METTINIQKVSKAFHNTIALDDIDFQVGKGEIFSFLGPSGAGKSTMINILTGQLKPDRGQTFILGKNSQELQPNDLHHIGIMSDTVGFYEAMSLYDNLLFFAKFHHVPQEDLDTLITRLDLEDVKKTKAGKLSTGQRQRMLLIRAILHKPALLFLDEPTSGLDPSLAQKVHHILKGLQEEGVTIFMTTHNMEEARKLSDTIGLLYKGKMIEYGSPQDIIAKYSQSNQMIIRFKNGKEIMAPKDNLAYYDSSQIVSLHTQEASLETIFLQLTGADLDD